MSDSTPISVCMASHNGERWIEQQVRSVLSQLCDSDELIIVDDASTDQTIAIVEAIEDPRVRIVAQPMNRGYVATFETALSLAIHDNVFLADQDDLWPPDRIQVMQAALREVGVVVGSVVDLEGKPLQSPYTRGPWHLTPHPSSRRIRTLVRLAISAEPYFGSAMAIRRDVLDLGLPFPPSVRELHDAWLGLLGLFGNTIAHLDAPVVWRRTHASNASGRVRSVFVVLRGRVYFLRMAMTAWRRTRRLRRL